MSEKNSEKELDAKGYYSALRNLYKNKSDLAFINNTLINQISVLRVILEGAKDDAMICCRNLDVTFFNNDLIISALKTFLSNGKKLTLIVDDQSCSEDIKKIYKGYVENFKIYYINDDLLRALDGVYKEGLNHEFALVCGNAFAMIAINDKKESLLTGCFNNSKATKNFRKEFEKVIPKLERVNLLTGNSRFPKVSEVLYKFRGVPIEEHVLRDIVEFAQGKTK